MTWLALVWLGLGMAACSGPADPRGTIRWRAQAGTWASSWQYQDQFEKFVELVHQKSDGRLQIQIFPPGTIVDAYQQFSAVQRKAVEVGMGVGGYNLKQVPEAYIEQGLFGVFANPQEFIDFYLYYRGGEIYRMLDEAYREQGCHLLRSLGPSPLVLITREPINSLEQIRGMKVRGSGSAPDLIRNLGAVPVTLPPADIYMALQTGIIDGVILPNYTIGTVSLWDIAKGIAGPPFGHVAGDIYVNLEAYDGLSQELQGVVEQAAEEAMYHYLQQIQKKIGPVLQEAQQKHGVRIVELPPEEYTKILKAAAPLLDEAASRSPRSERMIGLLKEYLREKDRPILSFEAREDRR